MTRQEVFAALKSLGITKVRVDFAGGHDDGGVEGITMFKDEEVLKLPVPGGELQEALEAPVYDKYSSFAGEFYVDGTVVWNVLKEAVSMTGQESHEEWDYIKEDL